MPTVALLGSLFALALGVAACGGDGASDATGASELSKAEFIARADQICESTDSAQRTAIDEFLSKRPEAAVTKALKEEVVLASLPFIRTEARKLDALAAPEENEDEIQEIIDGIVDATNKGEADPSTMVIAGSSGPFTAVGKLAVDFGFKACAFPL